MNAKFEFVLQGENPKFEFFVICGYNKMTSGLLSNFNVAVFGNSYPRAVRVKQQCQPLQLVQALFSPKSFGTRYAGINMTAASGNFTVDRNLFGFVKPSGGRKMCSVSAPVSHHGGRGCLVYNCEQMYNSSALFSSAGRAFSSSCHSDGSFSVEELSSVAVSAEQYVFLFPGL